jgi:hypothetical protein
VSVRLRPGVLIDDAQLSIVNAVTAETLALQMNVQPNVRNAHCVPPPKDIPSNPDISQLYTVGNMSTPDNPDTAKLGPLQPDDPGGLDTSRWLPAGRPVPGASRTASAAGRADRARPSGLSIAMDRTSSAHVDPDRARPGTADVMPGPEA